MVMRIDGKNKNAYKQKTPPMAGFFVSRKMNYLFTLPASSAPALNFTTFLAEILIAFPVCGLRPVLAALLETEKDPKPTNATRPPFFKAAVFTLPYEANGSLWESSSSCT